MTPPASAGSGRVIVVGGGLAGIAAALRLADGGARVTLLESKPWLGGLTASFRRGELEVDTGQHVFLRCCTAYRSLLDRLGVAHLTTLQPRLEIPVVRASDGRRGQLARGSLPVVAGLPLHLARSLARYAVMPPAARLAAARAALAIARVDPEDPRTDEQSFGDWLVAHRQPAAAVDGLWDLIGTATLNARASEASLALAATVVQLGLLREAGAADIGWSRVPLGRLHGEAAHDALQAAGAEVRLRARVAAIATDGSRWTVTTGNESLTADAVVVAIDPVTAERVLPEGVLALPTGWSEQLGATPIINVHVVLDRRVMAEPFLATVGSPLQWLFDRTEPAGLRSGQYLAASLSAADGVAALPVEALRDRLLPEFGRVLPAMTAATVVDFFVTREPHATFRQSPGSRRWRPTTATTAPGIALAGAHTATGWPATMEGAVRSGDSAARHLLPMIRRIRQEVPA
jgi:squalene-associated FAD-dependent desaturase